MKWPARWPCTRWENCTALWRQKKGVSIVAPQTKAHGVLPGRPVGLSQELHGGQRSGRPAGPIGQLRRGPGDARTQPLDLPPIDRLAEPRRSLSATRAGRPWRPGPTSRPCSFTKPRSRGGKMSAATANDVVRWVDPQAFAQTSTNTPASPGATPRRAEPTRSEPAGRSRHRVGGAAHAGRPSGAGWNSPMPAPPADRTVWGQPVYQIQ